MLKREWGAENKREATAPIQSLVKLQPWFLTLRWKTCLGQNCSLEQNTHDDDKNNNNNNNNNINKI